MATIKAFVERFKNFDVKETAMDTFLDLRNVVLNLNKEQLEVGVKSNGSKIGEYKSENYAEYKYDLNSTAGFGNVDLYLSGDFFFEMKLEGKGGTEYEISSDDWKNDDLVDKYGKDIFGMTEESRTRFIDGSYLEKFKQAVKDKLQLP